MGGAGGLDDLGVEVLGELLKSFRGVGAWGVSRTWRRSRFCCEFHAFRGFNSLGIQRFRFRAQGSGLMAKGVEG